MDDLIAFGTIFGIVAMVLRHRYRMKLLAAAMTRPDLVHLSAGLAPPLEAARSGSDAQVRIDALEEKLEWMERLVRASGDAQARARIAPAAPARVTRLAADVDQELRALRTL